MDFNLDTFVEQYTAALKAEDNTTIASLIDSLGDAEQRKEALAAVIAAVKGDEDLMAKAAKDVEQLEMIQEVLVAETTTEAVAEAATTEEA